jgi:hypothetical protein
MDQSRGQEVEASNRVNTNPGRSPLPLDHVSRTYKKCH